MTKPVTPTRTPRFATPEDAEAAFYDAIERADIDAMMAVWSEDDEIVCVHPNGTRLIGHAAVRAGWLALFQTGTRMHWRLSQQIAWHSAMMAVHNVVETLYIEDNEASHGPIVATNVYIRGPEGWHISSHHASSTAAQVESHDPQRVLH
jgi:ketosteroid isomerase-like protein